MAKIQARVLTPSEKRAISTLRNAGFDVQVAGIVAPATKTEEKTFFSKKDIEAGNGFPCTADGGCGRLLRTAPRAAIHGIEAGGHAPAK